MYIIARGGKDIMEQKDCWRVRCDMTGESSKYDVFRGTKWDKRKRRFADIEFAPGQPIEGFDDEMDAWKLARTLNGEKVRRHRWKR